ncbi:hypothetical protein ANCDUO_22263 [Ancylostoma duodenale]|uniref:Uncharacterized protein n=1 Tax=Ancylostoma duodenale TaxID=51022 RepID=A0A0C2BUQ3_9BILA|nr:hypothetical protein ANCDUO_22263 [Ancylostoma duodenale]
MQEPPVSLDPTDNPDAMDNPEALAHLDHLDPLDPPDPLEPLETLDSLDNLDLKESVEFVRNIARWTAEYSSKTERDDKQIYQQITSGAIYLYVCNKRLCFKSKRINMRERAFERAE